MNKKTLESVRKTANNLRGDLLFRPKEFDDKSAWTLVLTFIEELTNYELDRLKEPKMVV